jgi:hypothetical protein
MNLGFFLRACSDKPNPHLGIGHVAELQYHLQQILELQA